VFEKTSKLNKLTLVVSENQINDAGIADLNKILEKLPNLLYLSIYISGNKLTNLDGFKNAFRNNI
jgi:hypothetical protein